MGNVYTSFSSEAPSEQVIAPLVDGFAKGLLSAGMDFGQFTCLHKLCVEILEKNPGGEDFIWPRREVNHVKVWDEVQPHINNWRFIVYIVWLKKQSDSFAKFCRLKAERKEAFDACLKRLIKHVKHDEELQTQKELTGTV